MTFYLALVVVLVLLALILRPAANRASRTGYAIASFVTLGTCAAVRASSVGADTFQYYQFFTIIGHLRWRDHKTLRFESGYFLLNRALYVVTKNPQIFIAATDLFVIAVLIWFFWKYSPNLAFTVVLFVLLQGYAVVLSALRQSLAMAIVLLVVPALLRRSYWRFLLGIGLATQFHSSAVVLLVLIPLVRVPLKIPVLLLNVAAAAILAVEAGKLVAYAGSTDSLRYGTYAASDLGRGNLGVFATLALYFGLLVIATAAILHSDQDKAESASVQSFLCYSAWLIVPSLGLAAGSNAFLRFAVYFVPFVAVFIPEALRQVTSGPYRSFLSYGFTVVTLTYFIAISILRPEWYEVIPYKTIFS